MIINFLNRNLKKIEEQLISKHSERKKIIQEAFKAHKSKMFYSSTILFISLSDGISETKMFINRKKFNSNIFPERNPEIIKILSEESPLNIDTRKEENPNFFSELNRHSVMHGLSYEYGKEINSLKALSLCCFVSDWYNRY